MVLSITNQKLIEKFKAFGENVQVVFPKVFLTSFGQRVLFT